MLVIFIAIACFDTEVLMIVKESTLRAKVLRTKFQSIFSVPYYHHRFVIAGDNAKPVQ